MSESVRAHIRALLASAPPLTETQRARVLALLRPGIEATRR